MKRESTDASITPHPRVRTGTEHGPGPDNGLPSSDAQIHGQARLATAHRVLLHDGGAPPLSGERIERLEEEGSPALILHEPIGNLSACRAKSALESLLGTAGALDGGFLAP